MAAPTDDPLQILGFEFVEYATPDPRAFGALLEQVGFRAVARHRSKDVGLYRQGDINVIVNADVEMFERSYSHLRAVRICAIALRVRDAAIAYEQALRAGAWEVESPVGVMEVNIPAIAAAGDTLIYFVDRFEHPSIYDIDFVPLPLASPRTADAAPAPGLARIHSITYRVADARDCATFCADVLGFQEVRGAPASANAVTMTNRRGDVQFVFVEGDTAQAPAGEGEPLEIAQHATFSAANLQATIGALEARGVRVVTHAPGMAHAAPSAAGAPVHAAAARRVFALGYADEVFFELVGAMND